MDVFILAMGLTLLAAGWFLLRDFTRFLSSGHTAKGKVVAIQQALAGVALPYQSSNVYNLHGYGFYPVIEYLSHGESVLFTMVGDKAPDRYHIGDVIDLRISRSRRLHSRISRSTITLIVMLTLMFTGLLIGGMFSEIGLTKAHIFFSSGILMFSLFLMVAYYRCQDESCTEQDERGSNGQRRVLISEPCAFSHWPAMMDDRLQKRRVFGFRLFGAGCLVSGVVVIASAFFMERAGGAYGRSFDGINQQFEQLVLRKS